jgi:hypothetical protein
MGTTICGSSSLGVNTKAIAPNAREKTKKEIGNPPLSEYLTKRSKRFVSDNGGKAINVLVICYLINGWFQALSATGG